jgi:HD-GYP domain-containing protein (c-di-GMP phosphodiesterase class II)
VADLASAAAERIGLPADDVVLVRRAGWVHDLGMIGVPSGVWDDPQPWTLAQKERARTHPYLTERMLARLPSLAAVARCAAQHHERLDGSGYPHGLRREALSMVSRVLAAADVHCALRADRPHRKALPPQAAAAVLRAEVDAGRLDEDAVHAVLLAAGHRVRAPRGSPTGLTAREIEVLVHLARGLSNPQIAAALTVSRKTVSTHLEHIYSKLGVSTRTQAALFAMRHGLAAGGTS